MKRFKVALQLFSIAQEMEEDMDAALAAVKEIGYDYVEHFGIYDFTIDEIRALMDKHGLECVSVHDGRVLDQNQIDDCIASTITLGSKYCAIPGYDLCKNINVAPDLFARIGKKLRDSGIQLLYHNHESEFAVLNGTTVLDKMLDEVPYGLICPQLDTAWVHYAGVNPSEYIAKYSGRIPTIHLKDFVCKNVQPGAIYDLPKDKLQAFKARSRQENGLELRPLGMGIQDFPSIIEAAEKAGTEVLIVEQDCSPDRPPIEAARISREYLRSLGL